VNYIFLLDKYYIYTIHELRTFSPPKMVLVALMNIQVFRGFDLESQNVNIVNQNMVSQIQNSR